MVCEYLKNDMTNFQKRVLLFPNPRAGPQLLNLSASLNKARRSADTRHGRSADTRHGRLARRCADACHGRTAMTLARGRQ